MSSSENILQLILEMQQKIQKIISQSEYLSIGADPTKKFSVYFRLRFFKDFRIQSKCLKNSHSEKFTLSLGLELGTC